MRVDQLEGKKLAEWVARALGYDVRSNDAGYCVIHPSPNSPFAGYISDCKLSPQFEPHTDWAHGGPVVDRLIASGHWQIEAGPEKGTVYVLNYHLTRDLSRREEIDFDPLGGHNMAYASFLAPSVLIAACRALVFSVYGTEVPD